MSPLLVQLAESAGFAQSDGLSFDETEAIQLFAKSLIAECESACSTDRLGKTVGVHELLVEHFGLPK